MSNRLLATLFVFAVVILGVAATVPADESALIVRFDLGRRTDFEHFKSLNVTPFFRMGNIFFAEIEREQLHEAQQADIPCEIVDTDPFGRPYYIGSVEALPSRKVLAPDLELLAEIDEYAFYAARSELDLGQYQARGFELVEIQKREIPLKYFDSGPVSPNPQVSLFDPVINDLVAAVSQDSLFTWTTRLEEFQTRLTLSDSMNAARDWIRDKFESFGYTNVALDEFWCPDNRLGASGWTDNIVCIKDGTVEPDKVIVIGGHWDSIIYDGNDPYVFAPGADDNAAGVAATMEIARILAGISTKKTIHFLAFGSEENGLLGAWRHATEAVNAGTNIELMINLDVIAFTADEYDTIYCGYKRGSESYLELMSRLGSEYTTVIPEVGLSSDLGDHYPFHQMGFKIANIIEGDLNTPYMHTVSDITANLDLPYLTEVTRMVLATLYTMTVYPSSIDDGLARDVGDGQSLQVEWTALNDPEVTGYWVYWGSASESYDDSVYVAGVTSNQTMVTGLIENQEYFFTVVALDTQGRESFLRLEFSGTPRIVPLAPGGFTAEPAYWQIELSWADNQELDFDHYKIYRGLVPGVYSPVEESWGSSEYIDTDVSSTVMYEYVITAVDADENESIYSVPVQAAAATFDQGILILDLTPPVGGNPSAAAKEAFFNSIFSGLPKAYEYYDPVNESLNKSIIGQYGAILWYDDGNAAAPWNDEDVDKLRWYLGYNTNVFLTGWRVGFELADLTSPQTIGPGNILYDYVGVTGFEEILDVDLQGGIGQSGFPDVELDPDKVFASWQGRMGWIGTLTANNPANVIYTFDSYSGVHTGKTLGVRRDNGGNKFVFLSMPFYYLKEADARNLTLEVMNWFGYSITCDCAQHGDLNLDNEITPLDVTIIVNYVYKSLDSRLQPPMCPGDSGDWDCNGSVNPLDVSLFVNFVYKDLGAPCDPCACDPYPSNCP